MLNAVIVAIVWLIVAVGLGIAIGKAIRLRNERDPDPTDGSDRRWMRRDSEWRSRWH